MCPDRDSNLNESPGSESAGIGFQGLHCKGQQKLVSRGLDIKTFFWFPMADYLLTANGFALQCNWAGKEGSSILKTQIYNNWGVSE